MQVYHLHLLDVMNNPSLLIAINARTYNSVAIDSQGDVNFMKPNTNYSIAGIEKYVNSGFLLPEGLEQQILALAIHLLSHLKSQGHIITYVFCTHG